MRQETVGSQDNALDWTRVLLAMEGAALSGVAIFAYDRLGGGWLLFAALFFAPDLSMLIYLVGPRLGAVAYNCLHVTFVPLVLAVLGVHLRQAVARANCADPYCAYRIRPRFGFRLEIPNRISRHASRPRGVFSALEQPVSLSSGRLNFTGADGGTRTRTPFSRSRFSCHFGFRRRYLKRSWSGLSLRRGRQGFRRPPSSLYTFRGAPRLGSGSAWAFSR